MEHEEDELGHALDERGFDEDAQDQREAPRLIRAPVGQPDAECHEAHRYAGLQEGDRKERGDRG